MINIQLAIELTLYIITLIIGFNISKNKKDKHNKKYFKFKNVLLILISIIFTYIEYLLYISNLKYLLIINTFIIFYFYLFQYKQTRCWKQHRMIIYNFLSIPLIYYCSLILENNYLNLFVIILYIYNILEFQFAKFNLKQSLIWD